MTVTATSGELIRRAWLGLLLLASACTRAPAGTGLPEPPPISSECKSAELSICVDSCRDAACLEWCAGESCAATITSLSSCIDEVVHRGETSEQWTRCQPICSARVVPPAEGPSFCDDWRASYYAWMHFRQPPPARLDPPSPEVTDMLALGTSMQLVGELAQRRDDPHTAALIHMIDHGRWPLGDIESCVPELDARGREFFITLEIGARGAVQTTLVRGDSPGGECVANAVASALTLPVRVARDYPRLDVRVRVEPLPNPDDLDERGG
jgi:hypothetical protein